MRRRLKDYTKSPSRIHRIGNLLSQSRAQGHDAYLAEPSSPGKSTRKFNISALAYSDKTEIEKTEDHRKLLKKLDKFIGEKLVRKEKEHQVAKGFRRQYTEDEIEFAKGDLMAFFTKASKMKYSISRLEATEAIMKSVHPSFQFAN